MKRKLVVLLSVLCVTLICSTALAQKSGEPSKFGVLRLPYQSEPHFAPVSVAIEKGWFKEAGFDSIERKTFTAGALAGEALIGNEIELWIPGNVPVISMRHSGFPVVIAGVNNRSRTEHLIIRNDSNVKEPKDLYNIRIGLMVGSTSSPVLENLANHYGLDTKRLKVVNLPPPEQVTSLRNNEIQGMLVWPPFAYDSKIRDISSYRFESLKFSNTIAPVVFNEKFIREKREAAKSIMCRFYFEDRLFAVSLRIKMRPSDYMSKSRVHQEIWLKEIGIFIGVVQQTRNLSIDERYVTDMESYTRYLHSQGRIKDPIPALNYTYTEIVKEIRPSLVKVEGKWKP